MMKQLIRLGLMLVAVLAMVSCTHSTPGTALKNYMSALSDKDYEKFIDGYTCKYGFEQIVVGCKFQNGTVRQVKVDVRFQADRSREELAVGNEYGSSSL